MISTVSMMLGIDSRAEGFIIARRVTDSGSDDLVEITVGHSANEIGADEHTRVIIAVPDREVIVKPLHMKPDVSIDLTPRLHFELAASMLEPEETFLFDVVPSFKDDRFLGLVYRRERLASLAGELLAERSGLPAGPEFRARAVALGLGYLNFVKKESGGLVGLAEFGAHDLALCFLYGRSVVALGRLSIEQIATADDRALRTFGTELKTLVNFKLSELAGIGLSLPLSSLVLCGNQAVARVVDALAPLFSAPVTRPAIDGNRVRMVDIGANLELSDTLVALGLTVN